MIEPRILYFFKSSRNDFDVQQNGITPWETPSLRTWITTYPGFERACPLWPLKDLENSDNVKRELVTSNVQGKKKKKNLVQRSREKEFASFKEEQEDGRG